MPKASLSRTQPKTQHSAWDPPSRTHAPIHRGFLFHLSHQMGLVSSAAVLFSPLNPSRTIGRSKAESAMAFLKGKGRRNAAWEIQDNGWKTKGGTHWRLEGLGQSNQNLQPNWLYQGALILPAVQSVGLSIKRDLLVCAVAWGDCHTSGLYWGCCVWSQTSDWSSSVLTTLTCSGSPWFYTEIFASPTWRLQELNQSLPPYKICILLLELLAFFI